MKSIWKFVLPHASCPEKQRMPIGARLALLTQDPGGIPCMWCEVDPDAATEMVTLITIGTGHKVPEGMHYVGSYVCHPFVWHVYADVNLKQPTINT